MNNSKSQFKLCLALAGFLFSLPALSQAAHLGGHTINDVKSTDTDSHWTFAPAINFGYNKLLTGYDNYKDLGNLGLDLYLQPPIASSTDEILNWREHFLFRLSFDWFPLQVPDGVNGITEDVYSMNAGFLYAFNLNREDLWSWRPFLGFAYGIYRDSIVLDTPATGKITSSDNHGGFNLSAGIFCPISKGRHPLRLIPEIRYHRVKYVNSNASNMTYQIGLAYWFGAKRK